jgi:hypothetical protein
MRDQSHPARPARQAKIISGAASLAKRVRLKRAKSTASRRYITPEATRIPPANKYGRCSWEALFAKATVVAVEE